MIEISCSIRGGFGRFLRDLSPPPSSERLRLKSYFSYSLVKKMKGGF